MQSKLQLLTDKHSTPIRTRRKRRVFGMIIACRPYRATALSRPPHKILLENTLDFGRRILSENGFWGYARQKRRKSCRISEHFNEARHKNPPLKSGSD